LKEDLSPSPVGTAKRKIQGKTKSKKKPGLMPGIRMAFKEINDDLAGVKALPNAKQAISEI
jgi:hypothetical protein